MLKKGALVYGVIVGIIVYMLIGIGGSLVFLALKAEHIGMPALVFAKPIVVWIGYIVPAFFVGYAAARYDGGAKDHRASVLAGIVYSLLLFVYGFWAMFMLSKVYPVNWSTTAIGWVAKLIVQIVVAAFGGMAAKRRIARVEHL